MCYHLIIVQTEQGWFMKIIVLSVILNANGYNMNFFKLNDKPHCLFCITDQFSLNDGDLMNSIFVMFSVTPPLVMLSFLFGLHQAYWDSSAPGEYFMKLKTSQVSFDICRQLLWLNFPPQHLILFIFIIFSGHDFILDSVVENVINNISSFSAAVATTPTTAPTSSLMFSEEPFSNEIEV